MSWVDDERREYAEKKVKEMRDELQHEVDELKNDIREKDRKLGDLEMGCKETMSDFEYYRDYSKTLKLKVTDLAQKLSNKKSQIRSQIKKLKESIGVGLNDSDREDEFLGKAPQEVSQSEEEKEEEEEEQTAEEASPGHKEKLRPDIVEFTQLGYVWQLNKREHPQKAETIGAESQTSAGSTAFGSPLVKRPTSSLRRRSARRLMKKFRRSSARRAITTTLKAKEREGKCRTQERKARATTSTMTSTTTTTTRGGAGRTMTRPGGKGSGKDAAQSIDQPRKRLEQAKVLSPRERSVAMSSSEHFVHSKS